jgi:hypothetical protein
MTFQNVAMTTTSPVQYRVRSWELSYTVHTLSLLSVKGSPKTHVTTYDIGLKLVTLYMYIKGPETVERGPLA